MPRKMQVMIGETRLEAYIRNRTLEMMKIKQISVYRVAQGCPFMSQSGIYKCLNGVHKPSIQFLEAVCSLMQITLEEFFAEYDSTCYLQEKEPQNAVVIGGEACQVKKGVEYYGCIN